MSVKKTDLITSFFNHMSRKEIENTATRVVPGGENSETTTVVLRGEISATRSRKRNSATEIVLEESLASMARK